MADPIANSDKAQRSLNESDNVEQDAGRRGTLASININKNIEAKSVPASPVKLAFLDS